MSTGGNLESFEFHTLVNLHDEIKEFKKTNAYDILMHFQEGGRPPFHLRSTGNYQKRVHLSTTAACTNACVQYYDFWKDAKVPVTLNVVEFYNYVLKHLKIQINPDEEEKKQGGEGKKTGQIPDDFQSLDLFTICNTLSLVKQMQKYVLELKKRQSQKQQKANEHSFEELEEIQLKTIKMTILKLIWYYTRLGGEELPGKFHPFIYYKILFSLEKWGDKAVLFDWGDLILTFRNDIINPTEQILDHIKQFHKRTDSRLELTPPYRDWTRYFLKNNTRVRFNKETDRTDAKYVVDFNAFFDDIYEIGKYELYRQEKLRSIGDRTHFDVKRLIYALLIITFKRRYSKKLVVKDVLKEIFGQMDIAGLFSVGSHVQSDFVVKKGEMIGYELNPLTTKPNLSSVECLNDLLLCEDIKDDLKQYIRQLTRTWRSIKESLRVDKNDSPTGWYPEYEDLHRPQSWVAGHTLVFLKKFCELLSECIQDDVKAHFHSISPEKLGVVWYELLDSYDVKKFIKCMVTERDPADSRKENYNSALIHGPPGAGKTSIAKGLAQLLNWDFITITPGHFLKMGDTQIIAQATEIFDRLLQLKKIVVLFDEVDQPIAKRDDTSDPKVIWTVSSLLPRFSELYSKSEIKFILATNKIEKADEAAIRPGRIDFILFMGAITYSSRQDVFENALKDMISSQDILLDNWDDLKDLVVLKTKLQDAFNSWQKFVADCKENVKIQLDNCRQDLAKLHRSARDVNSVEEEYNELKKYDDLLWRRPEMTVKDVLKLEKENLLPFEECLIKKIKSSYNILTQKLLKESEIMKFLAHIQRCLRYATSYSINQIAGDLRKITGKDQFEKIKKDVTTTKYLDIGFADLHAKITKIQSFNPGFFRIPSKVGTELCKENTPESFNPVYFDDLLYSSSDEKKDLIPDRETIGLKCINCAKQNEVGSLFCNQCGKSMKTWECKSCGKENTRDNEFCGKCGKQVNVSETTISRE